MCRIRMTNSKIYLSGVNYSVGTKNSTSDGMRKNSLMMPRSVGLGVN